MSRLSALHSLSYLSQHTSYAAQHLRSCFTITELPQTSQVNITCNYCTSFNKTNKKFNPTKARTHLITKCNGADEELKKILVEGTQEYRRYKRSLEGGDGTISSSGGSGTAFPPGVLPRFTFSPSKYPRKHTVFSAATEKKAALAYKAQLERQKEAHYMEMWKETREQIKKLRGELRDAMDDDVDGEVVEELERDIRGLLRKKSQFGKLLGIEVEEGEDGGMGGDTASLMLTVEK
eukprot:scaffold6572_cov175-Alexandrium_tamarense.AAC.6